MIAIVDGKAEVVIASESCTADAQCEDYSSCTNDICNPGTGQCEFIYLAENCQEDTIFVNLRTDAFGNLDTSWTLVDECNNDAVVLFGPTEDTYGNNQKYQAGVTVPLSKYTFTILDANGDGICCGDGPGNYHNLARLNQKDRGDKTPHHQQSVVMSCASSIS